MKSSQLKADPIVEVPPFGEGWKLAVKPADVKSDLLIIAYAW